ncbi:right-handed parallel beta-helix repeat-containing protein, partial [Microbulbifer sp. TYP-18]|uniref:right-handed parallel beta-helix repeat-containing protein n=1 Tax=Microbulbifer sp. TYP-18 TaxID=3230024 RepID=UPI0034C6A6BE
NSIYDWHDIGSSYSAPVVDYNGYLDSEGGTPVHTGGALNGPIQENLTLGAGAYQIQGDVTVQTGSTLSIGAGAQFDIIPGAKLLVEGNLIIVGTAASPVLLHSAGSVCQNTTGSAYDWMGIEVAAGATVTIEHADIRCADKGIHFNGGEGSVTDSTLRNNVYGIYVNNHGTPQINGSSLYDNRQYNYYVDRSGNSNTIRLDATGNWWGTTDRNEIANSIYDWHDIGSSYSAPVVDYNGYLDSEGGTPVHTGGALNGPIHEDLTLGAGAQQIQGDVTVQTGSTLSIGAGAQFDIIPGAKLLVEGNLIIVGTAASPVLLHSAGSVCQNTTGSAYDWMGIEVAAGATVTIEHADIRCADKGIHFNGGDGLVSNSTLRNNKYGIYVSRNGTPQVTGSNLYNNRNYNYYTEYFSDPDTIILSATNNWWGTADISEITASIYDRNDNPNSSPLVNYGSYLDGINGQPSYDGLTLLGSITEDIVLPAGTHQMLNDVIVESAVTLTLEAGAILQSIGDFKLKVAGDVVAQGTSGSRVVFSSSAATPQAGDWTGIEVIVGGSVDLDYARVEGATYGLDFNGGQGTVRNSLFRFNTYGIYIRAGSNPLITGGNEITLNDYGIYVVGDGTAANNPAPVVTGNSLYGNSQYDYYAKDFGDPANTSLDITGNWWGTADAAIIATQIYAGAATSPQVDFSGYLPAIIGQPAVSISNVSLQNAKLNPFAGEQLGGTFGLNRGASVTLEIRREEDNALVYQTTQSYALAGDYPIQWDGRDNQGTVQAQGLYRAVLRADDGLDGFTYDEAPPSGVGGVYGSVPNRYDIYANEFYKIPVNMSVPALVTMQVTPSGESAFNAFEDVYYESGQHWFYWDGRDPNGEIIDSTVSIFYPAPKLLRGTGIVIDGTAPRISGAGVAPAIEVKADPYRVSHSYGQQTRMAYQLSNDAIVTFSLLPPGIVDPQHPSAIVLVDQELVSAQDATGNALLHEVEWRGYSEADPNAIVVGDEGVYTFAIQAQSPETGESSLYRGVVNLYR